MSIITRFAPSPSGNLHLGGARTALFNFLFAKSNNGKFFLRIEDSDRQRTTSESINNIINGLNWLGIHFNEPVYFQSKNFKKHVWLVYFFPIRRSKQYKHNFLLARPQKCTLSRKTPSAFPHFTHIVKNF